MANFHATVEPTLNIKKSADAVMITVSNINNPIKAVVTLVFGNKETKEVVEAPASCTQEAATDLLEILEKAAADNDFITRLTYQGSKALQDYHLTLEEKAAILSGDIKWLEAHLGKLNDRLKTWLWCRLQQEIW